MLLDVVGGGNFHMLEINNGTINATHAHKAKGLLNCPMTASNDASVIIVRESSIQPHLSFSESAFPEDGTTTKVARGENEIPECGVPSTHNPSGSCHVDASPSTNPTRDFDSGGVGPETGSGSNGRTLQKERSQKLDEVKELQEMEEVMESSTSNNIKNLRGSNFGKNYLT